LPRLWYSDHHHIPLPAGHKFPVAKYRLLRDALMQDERFQVEPAPFASLQKIGLVHEERYIRGFLEGTLDPKIVRRIGFPWSENLVRRTLASVGGTLAAAADAMSRGWGGNLAGGTHHAFRDEGSGFCVFNDIAVAIRSLQAEGEVRRAAVVDLDVHQGDGTASLFESDPEVLTFSMHGRDNFPVRKQTSRIDVPLPDGTGDDDYLAALLHVLPQVFEFEPDVVFYQSGVDSLFSDKLGHLALTHDGLRQRDRIVFESCAQAGVPWVVTLGGGYSEPVEMTVQAHVNTFRCAADVFDAAYST
jgi:acetoin utilization deacetylase AcuC-like enzyme